MTTEDQFSRIRAVKKGAVLLDDRYSSWWSEVDPVILDMSAPDLCVLGQLGKPSGMYFYAMVIDLGICQEDAGEACACHVWGFTIPQEEADSEVADVFWHELRTLWLVEIFHRREAWTD